MRRAMRGGVLVAMVAAALGLGGGAANASVLDGLVGH